MQVTVYVGPKVAQMIEEQRDLLVQVQNNRSPSGDISEYSLAHSKITDEIILCLGSAVENAINKNQSMATTG